MLKPGGLYIVEDLHFHHGEMEEHYRGSSSVNPIAYFEKRASIAVHRAVSEKENWGFIRYCRAQISSVGFAYGRCMIRKSNNTPDETWLSEIEKLGRAVDDSAIWGRIAQAVIGRRGPVSRAKTAAARAVELSPADGSLHKLLSMVYLHSGSIPEAIAAATRAVELDQHIGGLTLAGSLEQLGDLLAQSKRPSEALSAYEQAKAHVEHPLVAARLDQKIARAEPPRA
jgi:tetratricopeptide (TPR) repeat protein